MNTYHSSYLHGDLDHELNNILYTPLLTPEFPIFDLEKLRFWLDDTFKNFNHLTKFFTTINLCAENDMSIDYPWRLTVAHWNITGERNPGYINNFDSLFPEIVTHVLDSWKMTENELGTLTFLPMKTSHIGYGFWHSDPEPYGLRHYISFENNDINTLVLRKTREFYNKFVLKRYLGSSAKFVNTLCSEREYQCNIPLLSTRAFFINNTNAMHSTLTKVAGKERICLISAPKISGDIGVNFYKRNKKFILDSAAHFKDYSITYY